MVESVVGSEHDDEVDETHDGENTSGRVLLAAEQRHLWNGLDWADVDDVIKGRQMT